MSPTIEIGEIFYVIFLISYTLILFYGVKIVKTRWSMLKYYKVLNNSFKRVEEEFFYDIILQNRDKRGEKLYNEDEIKLLKTMYYDFEK